ncbi:glycosyltransferase family 2 protein [Mycobacterium avium subsp. hominissuis]|nr:MULTISPECIES: glycosyltransferase family 2 protein [Mycobacterium avium complex (MAC)]MDV3249384.1 glycosyltransferase family 2 protein [Mycobacterium avium subsp. hominissuis]MDV3276415.1 glycosyltransferase family 2 protein [Mycobacterium avium subsp. hominissuis]MDV3321361.1 glycosyltransferase family 2 protein [Mycobacterium avium subsp. hominissuis]
MIEALGIAMVKNEADVIEAFVRHNLAFMDALAIVDNDSVDDTREILVQLQRRGLPIILLDDPVVGHFQAEIMTAVYRRMVPIFRPRFVFLLDADEFIVASSRKALYQQLRAMRPGTQAQYFWRTYIPAPDGPKGDRNDPLRSITHRKAAERRWYKPIIVTKPKIDMKLKIRQGNHDVRYAGLPLRRVKLHDVTLAHFPVRSVDQFTGKILVGWIANLERNRHRLDVAHAIHWKVVYERLVRSSLTSEDLTTEALNYADFSGTQLQWPRDVVHDPVVPAYTKLTAQPAVPCTPLQKVVRSIDRIFNPEADISGLASDTEFLRTSQRKISALRHVAQALTSRGRNETKLYMDLPPFRYIAQRYQPASVLDIGCGSGAYLKYFASHGAERIKGVDNSFRKAKYLDRDEYLNADLGETLDLSQDFELVISLRGPHDRESERALLDAVARHARERIVICRGPSTPSSAKAAGHRTISQQLDFFASAGWYPCLFDTLTLRSLSTFPWFRSYMVVLTKEDSNAATAREYLSELERQSPLKWHNPRPAVIAHPFTEWEAELSARQDSRSVAVANRFMRAIISRAYARSHPHDQS